MAPPRKLTAEKADLVAKALATSPEMTLPEACIQAGIGYACVKQAIKRYRDEDLGEEMEQIVGVIARAIAEQCKLLLRAGNACAIEGKSTAWWQWRLENKDRHEYGRPIKSEVELTGKDGGPVQLAGVPTDELLKLYLGTAPKADEDE